MIKKGDRVEIKETAKYSGQDMKWTEVITHIEKYKKGHVFYHFSDSKLNAFLPKTTCFFNNDIKITGHCYALILNQDIEKQVYSNEVRFNLNENHKIIYLGEIKNNWDKKRHFVNFMGHDDWTYEKIDNRITIA
jgi:Iap family predicted aminopeptidase